MNETRTNGTDFWKVKRLSVDSQRQKIYDAESVLRGSDKSFDTLADVQKFINKILKSAWCKKHFPAFFKTPNPYITVIETKANRFARASYRTIRLTRSKGSRWSWCYSVVLHELAHILDGHRPDDVKHVRDNRAHGWQFAKTYVELVAKYMGKDLAKKLKDSYKKHGVRYSVPRFRKPLTEEQKAALRERVAKARNARKGATWSYYKAIDGEYLGSADTRAKAMKAIARHWWDTNRVYGYYLQKNEGVKEYVERNEIQRAHRANSLEAYKNDLPRELTRLLSFG